MWTGVSASGRGMSGQQSLLAVRDPIYSCSFRNRVAVSSGRMVQQTRSFVGGRVRAAVVDSNQGEAFEADVIQASHTTPVLVDFWATWCGPCKLVAPSMVWAADVFDGALQVVKIDCTDGNKELMETYKVYGLPCLIVFKDGAMVEGSHREGAITKKGLAEYLEKYCGLVQNTV